MRTRELAENKLPLATVNKLRVLMVEDEVVFARAVVRRLQKAGY